MAGAPIGNQNAKKLVSPELRADAYEQYCLWIAQGNSKEAWTFKHPTLSLTFKTMEKYIRENPIEFPSIHKEMAESESRKIWEDLGKQMMLGKIRGAQPAIYQMFMRNKFGWDKPEADKKEENKKTIFDVATDQIESSGEQGKFS